MPVYEFYCSDCHTVFSFITRRINTQKRPCCPRCGRPDLERQVSRFAISQGKDEPLEGAVPGPDDEAMERAATALAAEMGQADETDPRSMGRMMRRFSELAGMDLGKGTEEALRRLEAGEDPEKIEEEMGDFLAGENPFGTTGQQRLKRRKLPPRRDETLYPLE